MPSPRRTDAGLHRTKKSGWLSTENDEGSASPTAATAEFEFAAREKNSMPVTRGGNCRHLVCKHLPRRLHRDVRRLLDLPRLLARVLDLLDAGAPIEDAIGEWVLEARPTGKDNSAGGGRWSDRRHGRRGARHRVHRPHHRCHSIRRDRRRRGRHPRLVDGNRGGRRRWGRRQQLLLGRRVGFGCSPSRNP